MPVQTPHREYAFRKPDWQKVRAFAEGARVVKAAGEMFLPKPKGWTTEEYNAYRTRAEVYGAVDRTIDGLDGAIFRKAPTVELPSKDAEKLMEDVTLSGKTLTEFLRDTVREILTPGRYGVLVDFTGADAANPTATANAGAEQRPYLVTYAAEQIINWETTIIGGVTKLTMVTLEETVAVPSSTDPFLKVEQIRYRVLRLVDGKYIVEIHQPKVAADTSTQNTIPGDTAKPGEVVFEKLPNDIVPQRRGTTLDSIPFFFIGVSGQSISPEKPPLLDVTDLCVLHYLTSADYAHGLHWVALPTAWATGVQENDKISGMGPSVMITLGDPNAKVGMLEFTGQGLSAIEKRLSGLEAKMAALGARILEERKTQAESGDAIKLRQSGDASVLAGISDAVSRAAEAIIARMLWWAGTETQEPEVSIALNMEFFGTAMDPQLLTALMQARQTGEISRETFLWNLQKGEMLPEGRTVEDEMAKIATEAPAIPPLGAGGGTGAAAGGAA